MDFNCAEYYHDKRTTITKTRLIPILVVSAIVGAVCLAAGQQQKGKPAVQGNRCIEFPGTTIGSMRISESEMSQTDKYAKSIELTGLTGRIGECVKVKAATTPPMVDDLKDLIDDISKDLK